MSSTTSAPSPAPPPPRGTCTATTEATARPPVIYQGPDFHIHELALEGGSTWTHHDLTAVTGNKPGFQPIGYVRSDGTTAIVYYDVDEQVRQLKLS